MQELLNQAAQQLRPDNLASLFNYLMLVLALIAIAVTPEKSTTSQYLMFAVIFFVIVDLLRGDGRAIPIDGFDNQGFGTFLIHIGMFVFPLVAGGMVRRAGRKGGLALPMCLITGLLGGLYALGSFLAPAAFYSVIF